MAASLLMQKLRFVFLMLSCGMIGGRLVQDLGLVTLSLNQHLLFFCYSTICHENIQHCRPLLKIKQAAVYPANILN